MCFRYCSPTVIIINIITVLKTTNIPRSFIHCRTADNGNKFIYIFLHCVTLELTRWFGLQLTNYYISYVIGSLIPFFKLFFAILI